MKKAFAVLIFAAGVLLGCSDPELNCRLTLNTTVQINEQATKDTVSVGRVSVHAFFADTARWTVNSYDDALEGIITSRETGERRNFLYSETNDEEGNVQFLLNDTPVMIVVCDREDDIYAWRGIGLEKGLERMTIGFTLKPYLREQRVTESNWTIVYGETVGPIYPEDVDEDVDAEE